MKKVIAILMIFTIILMVGCSNSRTKASKPEAKKTEQNFSKSNSKTGKQSNAGSQNNNGQNSNDKSGSNNNSNNTSSNSSGNNNGSNGNRGSTNTSGDKTSQTSNPLPTDNKIIGWGLKLNTGEKPPEVPSSWIKMLKEYNGYYIGDQSKKIVYLTFDEGYEAGNTGKILDILRQNNVKAAFFVTGHFVKTQPDLLIRMVKEGHVVGNHTVNHPSLPTISNDKIKEELDGVQKAVYDLTHYKMKYVRPPKGEFNGRTLAYTKELGFKTVFWSMAFADWQPMPGGPEQSYNNVMKYVHPGAIILLHAVSNDNTAALDRIIKGLKEKGYEFKTLDDLSK